MRPSRPVTAGLSASKQFNGIAGIGDASLRGTDGTNLHAFSEEIEARGR